ncbi:MAG: hypothetical protein ACOCX4_04100 [Planctomycetota bacterium]
MKRQDDQPMQPEASFELEVYDAQTDERLGHLGDINRDGLVLTGARTYDLGRRMPLRIVGDRNAGWREAIEAEADVVGSREGLQTDVYDTELRFTNPTPLLTRQVDRLRELAETPPPDNV